MTLLFGLECDPDPPAPSTCSATEAESDPESSSIDSHFTSEEQGCALYVNRIIRVNQVESCACTGTVMTADRVVIMVAVVRESPVWPVDVERSAGKKSRSSWYEFNE